MTDLPEGWEWSTVGEVGSVGLGRQRAPKWHHGPNMRPYLRVANVFEDRIDLSDVKEMDFSPDDFERFKLEPGDILLNEGQSPEWVGRPAMYRGELPGACFTNSLIRFRPHPGIDGRFALYVFRHHLHARRFMREARITTNIAHLSSTRFATVEFPVPPHAEQQRIVAAIEEHLSRLAAAEAWLRAANAKLAALDRAVLAVLDDPLGDSESVELGDLCPSDRRAAYGVLQPGPHVEDGVPLVRVGDIAVDVIAGELKCISPEIAERYPRTSLQGGEVLITLVGTIGRTAVVPDALTGANVARAVCVLPIRDGVSAEYVSLALSAPRASRRLESRAHEVARKTLNLEDVRRFKLRLPCREEQDELVARIGLLRSLRGSIESSIHASERRSASLRRSIFGAAFSGRLVVQDPSEEPASVLLERIRTERAAASPTKRTRKAKSA